MRITATAMSLIREMSACEANLNNVLQQLDDCLHKTQFGAGHRRTRSAARNVELGEVEGTELFEAIDEYLESVG